MYYRHQKIGTVAPPFESSVDKISQFITKTAKYEKVNQTCIFQHNTDQESKKKVQHCALEKVSDEVFRTPMVSIGFFKTCHLRNPNLPSKNLNTFPTFSSSSGNE